MFNFPKVEDVYRPYLKSELEMSRLRAECEGKLRDFNDLRQLSETSIGKMSFEKLFLPYDFAVSMENYKNLSVESVDEILEKYTVLKYLVSDGPMKYLDNRVDYFDNTIFAQLIRSKYKSHEQLMEKLEELDRPYKKLFNDFHNAEIHKILSFPRDKEKSSMLTRLLKSVWHLEPEVPHRAETRQVHS